MTKRNLQQLQGSILLERRLRIWTAKRSALKLPWRIDIMFHKQFTHEVFMGLRNALRQRTDGDSLLLLDRHILRDEDINPIGFALNVIVDPLQFHLKLIRR